MASQQSKRIRLKDYSKKKEKERNTASRGWKEFLENARAKVENAVRTIYSIAIRPACSDIVRNYSGVSTDRRDTRAMGRLFSGGGGDA